jgi:cytochrome d ubiquinol oxidase subunit I
MEDLLSARLTMAWSLGFHIIFACIGMIMPFFMATSHYFYLKYKRPEDLALTKMWSKGVAILFAIGAVSGTVLSFELGLLWPNFMKYAGPIIGMPFSWEGTAFFLEAIAIGLFLYGWNRMSPWVHWWSGVMVGFCGFASGIFILSANSWMNAPSGFEWVGGSVYNVDPVAAMFNSAWATEAIHMQIAAFQAVGFAVAGIHGYLLLKGRNPALNKKAFKIAMAFAAIASLLQPLSGHFSAARVGKEQPEKLAAMESHFHTEKRASFILGGIPNVETGEVPYSLKIPGLLSFLVHEDIEKEVKGLYDFPKDERPPVLVVHFAFQIMILCGLVMAFVGSCFLFYFLRKKEIPKWILKLVVMTTPLGFLAVEAGWTVTEVGRQPWVIYKYLKTADALTPKPGLQYHFFLFLALYVGLAFAAIWLLRRQVIVANEMKEGRHD